MQLSIQCFDGFMNSALLMKQINQTKCLKILAKCFKRLNVNTTTHDFLDGSQQTTGIPSIPKDQTSRTTY
uniref:Uncharacterized protein n=1 Tax=Onchocerca volvulus TaxID=6282 RepID=A0A8R1XTQ7_ONCVO